MAGQLSIDHVHLISADPRAAAHWYEQMLGGEIVSVQEDLRGAPQIEVRLGGVSIVIRGARTGESPVDPRPMQEFDGYSSLNAYGIDHFAFTYRGDLRAFCEELRAKGVSFSVEPWEFKPGMILCYIAAPDGVHVELMEAGR